MKTFRQAAATVLFAWVPLFAAAAPTDGDALARQGLPCDRESCQSRLVVQAPYSAFEEAKMALERGHYTQAHRLFALLADCGHRESARIALEMRQFGPRLYGMAFTVEPKRLARWRGVLGNTATATAAGDAACVLDKPAEPMREDREIWRHHGVG